MEIELILGDAVEEIKKIKKKVNCIIADVPQGITKNKWDVPFNLEELWQVIGEIADDDTPVILMSNQPYTAELILSNRKNYKYSWYWQKLRGRGHLNVKRQPLRNIEEICVFYKKQCFYSPIMTKGKKCNDIGKTIGTYGNNGSTYGKYKRTNRTNEFKYPKQLLFFKEPHPAIYSTQKPVELIEYLLETYTKGGDTVLDFCMGSGTTGVACKNLNRDFIGIDKSIKALELATKRIKGELNG